MLQRSPSVWRFSSVVSPPLLHGTIWSTCSTTPGSVAGERPHARQLNLSRRFTRKRSLHPGPALFLAFAVATGGVGGWPSAASPTATIEGPASCAAPTNASSAFRQDLAAPRHAPKSPRAARENRLACVACRPPPLVAPATRQPNVFGT